MKIAMIGGGYVGLVSGACFADLGVEVCVVERDAAKLDLLLQGRMPIYEPGLDRLVHENVAAGRLRFTDDLARRWRGWKRCSSPSAPPPGAAMATPTSATSTPRPSRWRAR